MKAVQVLPTQQPVTPNVPIVRVSTTDPAQLCFRYDSSSGGSISVIVWSVTNRQAVPQMDRCPPKFGSALTLAASVLQILALVKAASEKPRRFYGGDSRDD